MAEAPSTRKFLEQQRDLIRRKLRAESPRLMRELESVELAIANLSEDRESTQYAGYPLGIDAVEAWLKNNQHTAKGIVIAKEVVRGGWKSVKKNSARKELEHHVIDSIRFHLKPVNDTKRIKAFEGDWKDCHEAEIGLYEWDDSFRQK